MFTFFCTDRFRTCSKHVKNPLVVSAILANNGIDPILQLTTRDRNRIAIQSDLLGGWALNIRNILCIFGDQVTSGDQPDAKEVRDLDSLGIIQTANQFKNDKVFPSGIKIQSAPEYFIGAADAPFKIDDNIPRCSVTNLRPKTDKSTFNFGSFL